MSEAQAPGPQMPTGTLKHSALEFYADGGDPNLNLDLYSVAGLKVTFTPYIKPARSASFEPLRAAVWTGSDGVAHTLIGRPVRCVYDPAGRIKLLERDGTPSTTDEVRLAATTAAQMIPVGWVWRAEWENGVLPTAFFTLDANEVFDLSALVVNAIVPGAAQYFEPLLERALTLEALIAAGGGGPGGGASWGNITGQPPVIAAGNTAQQAREVIGAVPASDLPTRTSLAINNVTNTSDANKPVSAAMQTELNRKATSVANAPGTWCGARTRAQWDSLGAPAGTGPFWGVLLP